eukprot:3933897-Rhodomonas_salina.3
MRRNIRLEHTRATTTSSLVAAKGCKFTAISWHHRTLSQYWASHSKRVARYRLAPLPYESRTTELRALRRLVAVWPASVPDNEERVRSTIGAGAYRLRGSLVARTQHTRRQSPTAHSRRVNQSHKTSSLVQTVPGLWAVALDAGYLRARAVADVGEGDREAVVDAVDGEGAVFLAALVRVLVAHTLAQFRASRSKTAAYARSVPDIA